MSYQAIETKYHGPTNHNPGRIIAKAEAGRVVHYWDPSLGIPQNHAAAAKKLAEKYGWSGSWAMGGNAKGDGYVFVTANETEFKI